MGKAKRTQYTPELRQEAVRLVESGQSIAAAARSLGMVERTLDNWVRARRAGTLKAAGNKTTVSAEQMENSRLRAELARVTMERDILHPASKDLFAGTPVCHPSKHKPLAGHPGLGKAVAYFAKGQK